MLAENQSTALYWRRMFMMKLCKSYHLNQESRFKKRLIHLVKQHYFEELKLFLQTCQNRCIFVKHFVTLSRLTSFSF